MQSTACTLAFPGYSANGASFEGEEFLGYGQEVERYRFGERRPKQQRPCQWHEHEYYANLIEDSQTWGWERTAKPTNPEWQLQHATNGIPVLPSPLFAHVRSLQLSCSRGCASGEFPRWAGGLPRRRYVRGPGLPPFDGGRRGVCAILLRVHPRFAQSDPRAASRALKIAHVARMQRTAPFR